MLSCLRALLDQNLNEILFEDAQQMLADILAEHANNDEFELTSDDPAGDARRELRGWIRRGLIVEREGRLIATDALQKAMTFAEGLDERTPTARPTGGCASP